MSERIILAFAGHPNTGKSTLATYLEQQHGFFTFEGSGYLKVLAESEGVLLRNREDYSRYYRRSQEELGKSWLADTMLRRPEDRLLGNGLRNRADYRQIKAQGGFIIALTCPPEICIQRADESDPKNPQTIEEYTHHVALDNGGTDDNYGLHTAWVVEHADYGLDTSLPIGQTQTELDRIIIEIVKKN